ncbi:MAG: hypothetical protein NZ933_08900, partial [Bacteroidia bacterium]|nr:hypothetical protein [Bacteroidia bacterium]
MSIFGPTTGRSRLSISTSTSSTLPGTEDQEIVSITSTGNMGISQPSPLGRLAIRSGWSNWIQLEDAINGHHITFTIRQAGIGLKWGYI